MSNEQESHPTKSFWKTLPGICTQVLGALTAITGLVTGVHQSSDTIKKLISKGGSSEKAEITTKYFKVIPTSLKNCIASKDSLYWFHIQVRNKSSQPLHLKVSFTVRDGPAGRDLKPANYTVRAKETISEKVNPAFELLNYDAADLDVSWLISEEPAETPLDSGTTVIHLLPRNVVAWDLTTPEGTRLPQDFLLASLTAWTVSPAPAVKERAVQLRNAVNAELDAESFARQWFAQCYNQLFKDPDGIKLNLRGNPFPQQAQQTIRMPQEVLAEKSAEPLEGALLLGALGGAISGQLRARLVIFATPETEQTPDHKAFLFAWSMTGSAAWRGLDISHAAELSFEENESQTSARIAAVLEREPDLLTALDASGTFIKEGRRVIALDLARAAEHFRIRGLP